MQKLVAELQRQLSRCLEILEWWSYPAGRPQLTGVYRAELAVAKRCRA
jgi:hypothetical protein